MKLEKLELSKRTINALRRHGINSIQELDLFVRENGILSVMSIRNIGKISYHEIKNKLEKTFHRKYDDERGGVHSTYGHWTPSPEKTIDKKGGFNMVPKNVCIWLEGVDELPGPFYISGCERTTWGGPRENVIKLKECPGCGKPIVIKIKTPAGPGYIDTRLKKV